MTRKRNPVKNVYMTLIFTFLYAPIAVLIVNSFNRSKSRTVWTGFTFDWYVKLFQNTTIIKSLGTTLIVALCASVVATVLGTFASVGIYAMKKRTRKIIMDVTYMPILNPEIVTGVSLMLLFVSVGIEMGYITLILAHVTFCVPYVILSVMPKLRQMDTALCDAARDLGASEAQVFGKVVIPEIMPGILSGFLMSITYSIDDFVISYFTYGADSQTLSITIYAMTRRKVSPEINALSTIIFLVILAVLVIMNVRDSRKAKKVQRRAA